MLGISTHRRQFWFVSLSLVLIAIVSSSACRLPASFALPTTTPIVTPTTSITPTVTLSQAATPTSIPTQVLPSPTPTQEPSEKPVLVPGPSITYAYVHLTMTDSLGSGVSARIVPEFNPSSDQDGYIFRHPAYVQLRLIDYPAPRNAREPYIYVAAIADSETGQRLETLLNEKSVDQHDGPIGQMFYPALARQMFRVKTEDLTFENGHGVRFLATYRQAPIPVGNDDLLYEFRGITYDRAYFVFASLPVSSSILPSTSNPNEIPPVGGVPYESHEDYWPAITERLEKQPDMSFSPSLKLLDDLLSTLEIK